MNQVRYKDRRLYNKLKRYWKLILKNRDELQSYNYKYYRLFDWLTHSQGIVDYLLQEVPTLKPEYETVHQLREAFQERDFNEFKEGWSICYELKNIGADVSDNSFLVTLLDGRWV